jgi:hypothetical protein
MAEKWPLLPWHCFKRDAAIPFSRALMVRHVKRACRMPVLNSGSVRSRGIKKGTSVTAALPSEFQRKSLEGGLWPLRLPDVKPPCILAPGE